MGGETEGGPTTFIVTGRRPAAGPGVGRGPRLSEIRARPSCAAPRSRTAGQQSVDPHPRSALPKDLRQTPAVNWRFEDRAHNRNSAGGGKLYLPRGKDAGAAGQLDQRQWCIYAAGHGRLRTEWAPARFAEGWDWDFRCWPFFQREGGKKPRTTWRQ